jgi:Fic family protein
MNRYKSIERAFSAWKKRKTLVEEVPKGWVTASEYAKKNNLSLSTVTKTFKEMREAGVLETRPFMIKTGLRTYPVMHYRNP